MWIHDSSHVEIICRQAALETGYFTSYHFKYDRNPFGLSWEGEVQRFDSYDEACYQYYRQIYCQYNGGDYETFLKDLPYAMDSLYLWKLNHLNTDKMEHRKINVNENTHISMCETCIHMPEGKVPQSNHEVQNGLPEQPFMYCTKKAFFPFVNYDNEGKPFYDVAKCDGYNPVKEFENGGRKQEPKRAVVQPAKNDGPTQKDNRDKQPRRRKRRSRRENKSDS